MDCPEWANGGTVQHAEESNCCEAIRAHGCYWLNRNTYDALRYAAQ